jgi:hypothetical protein
MSIGAALVVIAVGILLAIFVNNLLGLIVAAVGVIGLVLALVAGSRRGVRSM